MRFAIVVSRFNPEITGGLLSGAKAALTEKDIPFNEADLFQAPGAFEIPLIAQKLAKTHRYDGIICLGCVIKGETAHFEYISQSTSLGLMQASLNTETPISFGILTAYTDEQAAHRSRPDAENKGREAAIACVESVEVLRRVR